MVVNLVTPFILSVTRQSERSSTLSLEGFKVYRMKQLFYDLIERRSHFPSLKLRLGDPSAADQLELPFEVAKRSDVVVVVIREG